MAKPAGGYLAVTETAHGARRGFRPNTERTGVKLGYTQKQLNDCRMVEPDLLPLAWFYASLGIAFNR